MSSNVELVTGLPASSGKQKLYSTLETITIASTDRRVVYVAPERFEAPNWTHDGAALLFNRNEARRKPWIPDLLHAATTTTGPRPTPSGSRSATSLRKTPLAGLHRPDPWRRSPSSRHPKVAILLARWSPDGKTLAFVGERNGEFDIYSIPCSGGEETRLTTAKGLDDGPEYSPDGNFIYFNSERTGSMQIWRMKPDGSAQSTYRPGRPIAHNSHS